MFKKQIIKSFLRQSSGFLMHDVEELCVICVSGTTCVLQNAV